MFGNKFVPFAILKRTTRLGTFEFIGTNGIDYYFKTRDKNYVDNVSFQHG